MGKFAKNPKLQAAIKNRYRINGRLISNKDGRGVEKYFKDLGFKIDNPTKDIFKDYDLTLDTWNEIKKDMSQQFILKVDTISQLERELMYSYRLTFNGHEIDQSELHEAITNETDNGQLGFIIAKYNVDYLNEKIEIEYISIYTNGEVTTYSWDNGLVISK